MPNSNSASVTLDKYNVSKDKLLSGAFEDLRKELRAHENNTGEPRMPVFSIASGLIGHVHENKRLFHAVVGKRSSLVVQHRFRQLVIDLVEEDLAASDIPATRHAPVTHYIANALFGLLTWWVDSRSPLAPDELEMLFRELTMSVFSMLRHKK